MKTWRTIENKTDLANKKIKNLMNFDLSESNPRKGLAIFFAVLGLCLLTAGVSPFIMNNGTKADILSEEAGTVSNQQTPPQENNIFIGKEDSLEFNNEAEVVEVKISPNTKLVEEESVHGVAQELIAQPINIEASNTSTTIDTANFRINSHTGTEDKEDAQIQNTTSQVIAPSVSNVSKNAQTGPGSTALFLISPVLAGFFMRKKKLV